MPVPSTNDAIPARSPGLFRLFRWYARRYVGRHFHAVRVSRTGPLPDLPPGPLLVVMNHPSWWDPLIALILTGSMPGGRVHYAPIEATGLAQYPGLERIGFFGFEVGTASGARRFLRTSLSLLARPDSALWITAQGEFADPRERPTVLMSGIGHLARRLDGVMVVPLAIEYPFWNDRYPEALVRFGRPISTGSSRSLTPRAWTSSIAGLLEANLDGLAAEAQAREPGAFTTLIKGTSGVGGVYDRWRRLRARLAGGTFHAEHAARPRAGGVRRLLDDPARVLDGRTPTA